MTKEEIRAKYQPCQLESQAEFDRILNELNTDQMHECQPYLDELRELNVKTNLILVKINALKQELCALRIEKENAEQKRKEICRIFHDLKHEYIIQNPKELFFKEEPRIRATITFTESE